MSPVPPREETWSARTRAIAADSTIGTEKKQKEIRGSS
jgi:hypothetical protein